MDRTWQAAVSEVIARLAELQATRSDWESRFDVHSREVAGKVEQILEFPSSAAASVAALIRDPGASFRAAADTQVAAACWLYLHGDGNTRRLLRETLAPWGGLITLLTNLPGRLCRQFELTGNLGWIHLALAAIALLGDNADYRDDAMFLNRVRASLRERGHDPVATFREFAGISVGQAKTLFVRAAAG